MKIWPRRIWLEAALMHMAASLRDAGGGEPAVVVITQTQLDRMGITLEQAQAMAPECIPVSCKLVLAEPIPTIEPTRTPGRNNDPWRKKNPRHR